MWVVRVAHEFGKFPHEVVETVTEAELDVMIAYLQLISERARD